jgi:hypothetical protein
VLDLRPEQLGVSLAEAKALLARLQECVICQQAKEYTTCRRVCPRCYQMRPVKDYKLRPVDTLFGTVRVRSPRWLLCCCQSCWGQPAFSPLTEIIPRRCTPELEYLLARFSSLFPYRQVVQFLQECFPVGPKLNHFTVRHRTLRVAQRLEDGLAEEASAETGSAPPIDSGTAEGMLLSLDTGFVRSCERSSLRHFEVTVGRCERPGGPGESFGFRVLWLRRRSGC